MEGLQEKFTSSTTREVMVAIGVEQGLALSV